MPDSSIMLELCDILDITVNELLSGERIEKNHYEEKASENLLTLKRKDENHMNWNVLISILYTTAMVIAVFVCCICDGVVSGTFSWSLIVLSSVLFTWIITFPVILLGKKGIRTAMLVMNIFIFPFLYILSILLKVDQIFSIGAVMSVIAFAFFWMLYILYGRLKNRKLLAGGITCLRLFWW